MDVVCGRRSSGDGNEGDGVEAGGGVMYVCRRGRSCSGEAIRRMGGAVGRL